MQQKFSQGDLMGMNPDLSHCICIHESSLSYFNSNCA